MLAYFYRLFFAPFGWIFNHSYVPLVFTNHEWPPQVVDPAHCSLLKFLFLQSLEPYCRFIRSWIYEAKISDPYGEFVVEYSADPPPYSHGKAGIPIDFPLASVRVIISDIIMFSSISDWNILVEWCIFGITFRSKMALLFLVFLAMSWFHCWEQASNCKW